MLMPNRRGGTGAARGGRPAGRALRRVLVAALIACWAGSVAGEEFVDRHIREHDKGYRARPCGFDMDRNGVVGEAADARAGDGRTADPDGDGVDEDLIYVDADAGSDLGDGTAAAPYKTIARAMAAADGPGDGAEDIVCIAGVFHETIVIPHGGVPGHYERDGFEFPKNPLMIIGWDKDGDGQYPPFDEDDVAVLDGQKTLPVAIDAAPGRHSGYLEIAHLTIRDFGYRERVKSGAFKLFNNGGLESHVLIHDVELYDINRGHCALRDHSASIVLSFWGQPFTDVAFINNKVQDFGAYFCRGAIHEEGGRYRFRNNSLSMDPGKETDRRRSASGWKLWGQFNGCEVLDNVVDMNCARWSDRGFANGVRPCQGTRDWLIRGNVLIDVGVTLQSFAHGYLMHRPIDNIVIDGNLFWGSDAKRGKLPIAVHLAGHADAPREETIQNVTISNNLMLSAVGWQPAAIYCTAGNKETPQEGTIRITGNVIRGAATEALLAIKPTTAFKHDSFAVDKNVFQTTGGSRRHIAVNYLPSDFTCDENVYDPQGTFAWGRNTDLSLEAWQKATGQDAASRVAAPADE